MPLVCGGGGCVEDDRHILEFGRRDEMIQAAGGGGDSESLRPGQAIRPRIDPTSTAISSEEERRVFIIRSVPMLPDPMIATFTLSMVSPDCSPDFGQFSMLARAAAVYQRFAYSHFGFHEWTPQIDRHSLTLKPALQQQDRRSVVTLDEPTRAFLERATATPHCPGKSSAEGVPGRGGVVAALDLRPDRTGRGP